MPRNPAHGNCHCGDDELWIGLDELIAVVSMIVDHRVSGQPYPGHAEIRARLEASRRGDEPGGQGDNPGRM